MEERRDDDEESQREEVGKKREEDDGWSEEKRWKEHDKRREEGGGWKEEGREDGSKTSSSFIMPTAFLRSCLLFKQMEGVHLMEVPGIGALVGILGEESIFWQEVVEGMMMRIADDISDGFIFVVNELCAAEQRLFDRLKN